MPSDRLSFQDMIERIRKYSVQAPIYNIQFAIALMRNAIKLSDKAAWAMLLALALAHGLLYVWLVPPWQTPDEPAQFQYAALIARYGRTPLAGDIDAQLEQQITASLMRNH